MKQKTVILSVALIAVIATAFKVADDIITRLGMDQRNAQGMIIGNLVGSFSAPMDLNENENAKSIETQLKSFKIPYVPKLANIITGDKAAAAKDLCEFVKRYINSEEFIADYNTNREAAMPLTNNGDGLSLLKKDTGVVNKNINNYKKDTKYVGEQQQILDDYIKRINALTEASKKPFPGKENWEKVYPTDPSIVVKKRLQEYLALAATVDFKATLSGSGDRRVFTNPDYEKKSLKWKAIYRAGQEVNDVVTLFVKDWLKGEIIAKGNLKMTAQTDNGLQKNTEVNSTSAKSNSDQNTTDKVNTPSTTKADSTAIPVKSRKSVFKKIKEKAKSVVTN
jgi:hypothetical protein